MPRSRCGTKPQLLIKAHQHTNTHTHTHTHARTLPLCACRLLLHVSDLLGISSQVIGLPPQYQLVWSDDNAPIDTLWHHANSWRAKAGEQRLIKNLITIPVQMVGVLLL